MSTREPIADQDLLLVARMRDMARGGEVRAVRVNAGLSLREVAAAVGVHPTTVYGWETGKSIPHGKAAIRYSRLLFALEKVTQR